MGCRLICRSTSSFTLKDMFDLSKERKLPNPDPRNYRIMKHVQIGEYLLIKIWYPDCENYEGRKVLLFRSDLQKLSNQKVIDPHFSDNKAYISPIARFEPTKDGWEMGKKLIKILRGEI